MDQQKPAASLFDVFLRLRPGQADRERFIEVDETSNNSPTHITVTPPRDDTRRRAIERYAFTRVFEENAGQRDIFETTGAVQLVEGVLGQPGQHGRDGLLATLGVTGSGKSHTILGSKTQRGLTQLTLDLLYRHTEQYIANAETSETIFSSICSADTTDAQIHTASAFLDNLYGHGDASRTSRAATPAFVRDPPTPSSPRHLASLETAEKQRTGQCTESGNVYERLYSHKCEDSTANSPPCRYPPRGTINTVARFAHVTRSIFKLTNVFHHQESSLLSVPQHSKRLVPRTSTLPTSPSIDDIEIEIDNAAQYAIVISMYEVYNDRIYDLLTASATTGKNPAKRRALLYKNTENSPDRKVVAGLKKVVCSNLEDALMVLETGLAERRVAGTGSNATSSRSHGFFCIEVKKRNRGRGIPGPWSSSTMAIVDLAGSERARAAKTVGAQLAEGGQINQSLMFLGQCMQMLSDNTKSVKPQQVPYRQCKLTDILFGNSLAPASQRHRAPQKAIMIVAADPLGDYDATYQILKYSALAREVTAPRIPSISSTILSGLGLRSRPTTPGPTIEQLEATLAEADRLREELAQVQFCLEEEMQRRIEAEVSWNAALVRMEEVEQDIRDEVWSEMEAQMVQEQRRWRAAQEEEQDRRDAHLDRKLEIMARGIEVYEGPDEDKENIDGLSESFGKMGVKTSRIQDLEDENEKLREKVANLERERGLRSPSKKMRVLKTRKWDGSGIGLDDAI